MKYRAKVIVAAIAAAFLIIGYIAGNSRPTPSEGDSAGAERNEETASSSKWTCSMHPHIQQSEPGDCPICGMDLIPLVNDATGDERPRTMSMSESARALAEIETVEVHRDFPEVELRLVGILDYDETREQSLSARFPARIVRLFVNFTGERVQAGDHLAEVYSPDLLSAQRELLTAYKTGPHSSLTRAAREKLRLWGLLPDQIDAIIERGEALDHFEIRAPIGGVVVSKNVKEGDYVNTGQILFHIVDLSELWLNLDAYESDLTWLRYGQAVSFSVETFPGEPFSGTIAFIQPELNRRTRTVSVRVHVSNRQGRLKPGMFARGIVRVRMAGGGQVYAPELSGKWISPMHPEIVKDHPGQCDVCGMDLVASESLGYANSTEQVAPIVIPATAVLRTGKRAVVYLEVPNTGRPTFEGREIVLGPRAGDQFIVLKGLEEGERIVRKGAFKIDSALQIQARPSMMNPGESGPAPEHHPGGAASQTRETPVIEKEAMDVDIPDEWVSALVQPYLKLQEALAADDYDGALETIREMMPAAGHSGPLADWIHGMLAADSLEGMRDPYFEALSNALIRSVRKYPERIDGTLYVMHCPMAMDGVGADWLQDSESLSNPYFGAMMLRCGEIKETVTDTQDGKDQHGQ